MTASLHVEASGQGAPLVLLHGWAMHSGIWGPLVSRLAKRRRVHAVDLPGHGRSPELARFTLDAVVAALDACFAGQPERLAVIGWSLGGQLALRWALAAPQRIDRLVLVCTSPRYVAGDDWPHAASMETLSRFGDELGISWKLTIKRFLMLQMHGAEHSRATLASIRNELFARGEPSPRTLAEALDAIMIADLRADVAAVSQPAVVVSGSRDTLAFPEAGRWLAAHLPHARFALIEGAGHLPFLSHAEGFAAAIDGFLDDR